MMKDVYDKRQPYSSGSSYGRELEHPHTLAPSLDEGEFYLFAALLFGYKTAPQLWSRVAALWFRMAQSFFRGHEAQHQTYLHDALWILDHSGRPRAQDSAQQRRERTAGTMDWGQVCTGGRQPDLVSPREIHEGTD